MSEPESSGRRARSTSRSRTSRPTTPLRASSRSSFRESAQRGAEGTDPFPLNAFEPAFAELSDAVADLEANMMHFQLMHESLARFSESFASFLYGLNMNAYCVDFPEAPNVDSFRRAKERENANPSPTQTAENTPAGDYEGETTFMTTDTTFVENPSTASKPTPKKFANPGNRQSRVPAPSSSRGGAGTSSRRSGIARGRPSGLARPRGRGIR